MKAWVRKRLREAAKDLEPLHGGRYGHARPRLLVVLAGRVQRKKNGRTVKRFGRRLIPTTPPGWEPWAWRLAGLAKRAVLGPPPWVGDPAPGVCGYAEVLVPPLHQGPVWVKARAWPPDRAHALDLSGMLESVGDALELAGVVLDDKQIRSWDGSRILAPDPVNPRLEVEVMPYDG